MSVTRDDVLRIAQLAELEVDEATLPALAEQMSRILEYVAQISSVAASEAVKPFIPGPDAVQPSPGWRHCPPSLVTDDAEQFFV